jgi:4-hydroxy-tetrahydrodipicolinate synthase
MTIKPGVYAASMSIFNNDLSLDVDSTIKHAEKIIEDGLHGVVIFGSTGMAQLISSNEKKTLISKLKYSKYKDNFIIGTGSNSLHENVELIKHTLDNGINKFLLGVPAYYKFGDDGAYSFFKNLIQKVPQINIILYNFEKLFNYKFSTEIIEKLVNDFPEQIVGVKDSSYNLYEKLKIKNFLIFPGSETKLLKGLELGCSGIISAVCNVTGVLARKVYDDFDSKKKQTFNERLCLIRSIFDNYNLISGLHSFMSIEDKKFKVVLPPLALLSDNDQKELLAKLKKLDFFPQKNIAA